MSKVSLLMLLLLLAACQPDAPPTTPAAPPFPTMTAGHRLSAPLEPALALPLDGGFSNPATALAQASRPTPTPDLRACPPQNPAARLPDAAPTTRRALQETIQAYLNEGGGINPLASALGEGWGILGDGFARGDLDLTGEGTPEIILSYLTAELTGQAGIVTIYTCLEGRFVPLYETLFEAGAPSLLATLDMNANGLLNLVLLTTICANPSDPATCQYQAQIVAWSAARGRFINLLETPVTSAEVPTLQDIDRDRVTELIVRFNNPGTRVTGPLRTGFTVYDWNGLLYAQSYTQLDPPRFRIQVIHQADSAFAASNFDEASGLYELVLRDTSLQGWYSGDEQRILQSYALYRLLLLRSFTADGALTFRQISEAYADPANAPVYLELSQMFWNTFQATNNLNAACAAVRDIIAVRPLALDLLNRYGSQSPTYTAEDVCPF